MFHRCASSFDCNTYPLHSYSDTPRREGAPRTHPHVTGKTLHSFVNKNVNDDAEAIYTDAWKGYITIQGDDTRHDTVNHSDEEWVVGDVHNNGVEGVRLHFKLSIVAAFDQMSKKHLDRYMGEMKRGFNNRNNPHLFRKPSSASSRAIRYATESLVEHKADCLQSPAVDPSCPARTDKPRPARRPSTRASRLSMSAIRCAVSRRPAKISAPSTTPTLRIPINSALMALPALSPTIPFALIFPVIAVQGIRASGLLTIGLPTRVDLAFFGI